MISLKREVNLYALVNTKFLLPHDHGSYHYHKPEAALEQSHGTCFPGAALKFGRRGRAYAVPYLCISAGMHVVAHGVVH